MTKTSWTHSIYLILGKMAGCEILTRNIVRLVAAMKHLVTAMLLLFTAEKKVYSYQ